MFSEESTVTKIEVEAASGTVFVRSVKRVLKDGAVIAETLWSDTLYPGDDISKFDPQVQKVCAVAWENIPAKD